jgi:hypothetical protein
MTLLAVSSALMFGMGLGGLLVWFQQTDARARFRQEIESQIEQAIYGRMRRLEKDGDIL